MKIPSDSLSGKNTGRRAGGAGSSPARSILWEKLRKADRRCTAAMRLWDHARIYAPCGRDYLRRANKLHDAFLREDAKRKAIRIQMKATK